MAELMSLSVAGRENIKTVGSKNASKTFVGDHWEKYWGFVGMGWDSRCALGIGPEIVGKILKIGCWDWDYENRHWADTGDVTLIEDNFPDFISNFKTIQKH